MGVPGFKNCCFRHFFFSFIFFKSTLKSPVVIIKILIFTQTKMHELTQCIFLNIFHTDTLIFCSSNLPSLLVVAPASHLLLYACTPIILSTDICVQNETMSTGKNHNNYMGRSWFVWSYTQFNISHAPLA